MDEEKQIPEAEESKSESVSAFRAARQRRAEEARAAEVAAREKQAEQDEEAYQAREEYAKELSEEKVDLIRLKQGVITDSDKIFHDEEPEKKYTIWQKISNWFYHAKWWLGIAVFCVLVGGFLIYDYVTRPNPDIRLLMLSSDMTLYGQSEELCDLMELHCEDYTQDGEVLAEVIQVPVSERNMEASSQMAEAYYTQLMVQFQSDMCMLVLVDGESEAYVEPETMFVNLEELYPECELVDGWRFKLNDTDFAEKIGMTEPLRDGTCLALRKVTENLSSLEDVQKAYDKAVPVLEGLMEELSKNS